MLEELKIQLSTSMLKNLKSRILILMSSSNTSTEMISRVQLISSQDTDYLIYNSLRAQAYQV